MKKGIRKGLSLLMACVMTVTITGGVVSAEGQSRRFSVYGDSGENTITVQSQIQQTGGPLEFSASLGQQIQRDYDQTLTVEVHNPSDYLAEYYLLCENPYQDLYMNFVQNGSEEEKAVILPGETQTVELSIFAQNAQGTDYTITILPVVDGQETASFDLSFTCQAAQGVVEILQTGEPDEDTLAVEYTVSNVGDGLITDLSLSLTGDGMDYIQMNPILENCSLAPGEEQTVTLTPDLTKMKQDGLDSVTVTLTPSGGLAQSQVRTASSSAQATFSLEGRQVETIPAARLMLYQQDNPYYDLELHSDSYQLISTQDGTETDLLSLLADSGEGGSFTAQQAEQLVNEVLDPATGYLDLTTRVSGDYQSGTEQVNFYANISASAAPEGAQPGQISTQVDPLSGAVTTVIYMTGEEYQALAEEIAAEMEAAMGYAPEVSTFAAGYLPEPVTQVVVNTTVDYTVEGAKWVAQDLELQKLSSALHVYEQLNMLNNSVQTGVDIYNNMNVWSNPNATTLQKVQHTGLVILQNLNRHGTVAAYTALGGVAGTLVGIPLSHMIDVVLDDMLRDLEAEIPGFQAVDDFPWGDLFDYCADFFFQGSQCTNAGRTVSNFTLPASQTGSGEEESYPTQMVSSSRMSYGGVYNGYSGNEAEFSNRYGQKVNTDYKLNGETVLQSQEQPLSQVSFADLSEGVENLRPGSNTLERDYDTNAGHFRVTADTQIHTISSGAGEIGYLDSLDSAQEVRRLPDFAVYPENIVVEQSYIRGETGIAGVYVNNMGSVGGWVKVTVRNGTETVYQNDCLYLEAFSSSYLEFPILPSEEMTLSVELENVSVDLPESDSSNNTATAQRTSSLRDRVEPVLQSVETDLNLNRHRTYLVLRVTDYTDVVDVSATVNGELLSFQEGTLSLSEQPDGTLRCYAPLNDYQAGDYPVEITISYYATVDGQRTLLTKTESADLSMEVVYNTLEIAVDRTSINRIDEYHVYTLNDEGQWEIVEDMPLQLSSYNSSSWTYTLQYDNSLEYTTPLHDYLVLFSYEKGVLAAWADELEGQTLSVANGVTYTVSLEENEELTFGYLDALGCYDLPEPVQVKSASGAAVTVLAPPELIQAEVRFYATLDVNGNNPQRFVTMNLSPENGTQLVLSDFYDYYSYQIGTVNNSTYRPRAGITYRLAGEEAERYCSSYSDDFGYYYSRDTGIYQFFFVHEQGEIVQGELGLALGYGSTTAYFNTYLKADLTDYQPEMELNRSSQCAQVTFFTSSGSLADGDITFTRHNIQYLFRTNPIYLPVGSYNISFADYGITQSVEVETTDPITIQIQQPQAQTALLCTAANSGDGLTLSWPTLFEQGSLQWEQEGELSQPVSVLPGETVEVPSGAQSLQLTLTGAAGRAVFQAQAGSGGTLAVSDSFSGSLTAQSSVLAAGQQVGFSLSDLTDENGVSLLEYTAESQDGVFSGTITLQGENGAWEIPVTCNDLSQGVEATLPQDIPDGEYTYSITLQSAAPSFDYDVNGDTAVDVLDVMSLAQYVVAQSPFVSRWDYYADWELNVLDVMQLAQYAVNSPES